MSKSLVIAIDGPAAAGKGTLARAVAEKFNLAYLDTGALYRATGCKVLRDGGDPADPAQAAQAAETLTESDITDHDLRTAEAGQAASKVAAVPAVRAALLQYQRDYAASPPGGQAGAVLDGRDIGTVVCPDADVKLFITASAEVRAHRRFLELQAKGDTISEAQVLAETMERDKRDMERKDAPLKPAEDGHLLDTSELSIEAVLNAAVEIVQAARR